MNRCPITYELCEGKYSRDGLRLLSPRLGELRDFPYGKSAQLELALDFADKLSFSGVQPKLSAKLSVREELFKVVRTGGTFLLKPPHANYEELPQNEDLTMKLAAMAGIEIPVHGMVWAVDQSLVYFIQRFDRGPKGRKVSVEDFGQLGGLSREAKYDFSMEKAALLIEKFCTFPMNEKKKCFRLLVFNFLIGNEDMHAKNFSVIHELDLCQLSPAYDLVNSTIVTHSKEEIALPVRGKKSNLNRDDLVQYFGIERLGLLRNSVDEVLLQIEACLEQWKKTIVVSFLSEKKKNAYLHLLEDRWKRLFN
jgi:serine/threonine-protein kinase HipA